MRKLIIALILLCAVPALATDWYADSGSGDISTRGWHDTSAGSCTTGSGTALTYANRVAGDVFHANACTGISIAADPGLGAGQKVTLSTVTGSGAAGGGFTVNTSINTTLNVDIAAGTTTVLAISGSTNALTIAGNITGPTTASVSGAVSDTHTSVTVTVTGNITGGTNTNDYGYFANHGSGSVVVTGTATAGSGATATGFRNASTGAASITGDCVAHNTGTGAGCSAVGTGVLTITGNIIASKNSNGASGALLYTPAATNYMCMPKDASYSISTEDCTHTGGGAGLSSHARELPLAPAVTDVKSGVNYGSQTGTLIGGSNSGSAH